MTTHDWLIVLACAVFWLGIAVAWLWRRDKANHRAFAELHGQLDRLRARVVNFETATLRSLTATARRQDVQEARRAPIGSRCECEADQAALRLLRGKEGS